MLLLSSFAKVCHKFLPFLFTFQHSLQVLSLPLDLRIIFKIIEVEKVTHCT
jgi:hypothetical protein